MSYRALAAWTDVFFIEWRANELWRWLALAAALLGGLLVAHVVAMVLRARTRRLRAQGPLGLLALLLERLGMPLKLLALSAALYAAGLFMRYHRLVEDRREKVPLNHWPFWNDFTRTVAILAGAWFIFKILDAFEVMLRERAAQMDTSLNAKLVPLIRKALRIFVVILAFLFLARNVFGWDVAALIAGLGVGGLALALAARETLANIFGTVVIFSDQPFKLGDRIIVRGQDGWVEEVGFRSTRVRTVKGEVVVLPNSILANEMIINVSRSPYLYQVLDIPLADNTPLREVHKSLAAVREMLQARQKHFAPGRPGQAHVSKLEGPRTAIQVQYWFYPPDPARHAQFLHEFYLDLAQRVPAMCPSRDVST